MLFLLKEKINGFFNYFGKNLWYLSFFVGLSLLLSPQRYRNWYNDILSDDRRQLFGGLFALLIGSFIIAVHNIWVADWRVVLTLIGYWGVFWGSWIIFVRRFWQIV